MPIFWNNRCNSARNVTAQAFLHRVRAHLERPASLRIDPRASLAIAALWNSELPRLGCDVFRRYQKSRQPVGSLTFASADSVALVFEHRLDLLAQLRRVLMPVGRDRMLHGSIENFFFRARNFQRAVFLTRVIPAIDRLSLTGHCNLQFD